MIFNMHIRADYPSWGIGTTEKQRVSTLCGRLTNAKSAGIPGITKDQRSGIYGDGDGAWCVKCCAVLITQVRINSRDVQDADNPNLTNLYLDALRIATAQIDAFAMSPR